MTTSVQPEIPRAAEHALRLVPISADLLPAEIVEARRARKVRRIVLAGLTGFTVVLAAWYGTATYQTGVAGDDLARAEDSTRSVTSQQHSFDEVVRAQAETKKINGQLGVLLADDLSWSKLMGTVQARAAARRIALTNVHGDVVPAATRNGRQGTEPAGTTHLPSPTGQKPIGTVSISGIGPSKAAVADFVEWLASVPGLDNPLLVDATVVKGGLQFTARAGITKVALGGRFADSGEAGTGGSPDGNQTGGK